MSNLNDTQNIQSSVWQWPLDTNLDVSIELPFDNDQFGLGTPGMLSGTAFQASLPTGFSRPGFFSATGPQQAFFPTAHSTANLGMPFPFGVGFCYQAQDGMMVSLFDDAGISANRVLSTWIFQRNRTSASFFSHCTFNSKFGHAIPFWSGQFVTKPKMA